LWSEPGYTWAEEVISHMAINYPNVTLDSEDIDIINPDQYEFGVNEDGLTISINHFIRVNNETHNTEMHTVNNEENQLSLRESNEQWLDLRQDGSQANTQISRIQQFIQNKESNQLELL
jgi:hypothetical protein